MEARPIPSSPDEMAYINELREAFVAEAQTSNGIPCYTGENLKPFRPKFTQGYREWDDDAERGGAAGCLRYRPIKAGEDGRVKTYLEAGLGLTDLYCQRFFTMATEDRQTRHLQRGVVKTGDILMTAILGALNGVKNLQTFTHAGFGAVDSVYNEIDEAFLVAPSRDDLRKLVLSAQQDYRAHLFSNWAQNKERPHSYPSARSVIERYAGLCTFDGMRQLVADSVAEKTNQLNAEANQNRDGGGQAQDGTAQQPATPPAPAKPAKPAPSKPPKTPEPVLTSPVPITPQ